MYEGMATRREFLIGGAAVALVPSVVRAEQKMVTLIDYDLDDYMRMNMPSEQEWQTWARATRS